MAKHNSGFFNTAFVLFTGIIFSSISLKVFNLIYHEQKSPYIDEIFHVPQAKLYCKNQWAEWNPKITTLPGLYIVSYFFLKPLEKFGFENFCSCYSLRFTNLNASVLNFFLAFKISCLLEEKYKVNTKFLFKLLTALNITIFPPLYFFTFLYYTDAWSTTFVLLMYCLHLLNGKASKILGAFAAFMAVLMRQTNIIWVGLMIIDDTWNVLSKQVKTDDTWNVLSKKVKTVPVQDYKYSKKIIQKFISEFFSFKNTFTVISHVLSKSLHNLIVCLLFIIFIIINKSIVLGDKEAHAVTFHPMQNLYFLIFLAFFAWPFFLREALSLRKKFVNVFLVIFFTGLCAGLSETNKLEHPYLLADNRHLAFYLWKRLFGHSIFRRMIIPAYVCSAILLARLLQKRCHFVFAVTLSICTFLNLTPQYLFELRYFIVPFLLYRLQFRQSSAVILETVFFIIINFGVIYLFLNRPFVWPSEPDVKQRFIW